MLANEEVINGLSERGDHPVIRQPLRQWVLQITKYADKLERDLTSLNWPEGTLTAQKQWIGKSEGASIKFNIQGHEGQFIEVFTTRPDTLIGVTYLVLAPEHPLASTLVKSEYSESFKQYLSLTASKSDLERTSTGVDKGKTGVPLGAFGIHPLTSEKVPIYVADYVLSGYGTGAVMAVPAHDERDFEFAQKFKLPIKQVIKLEGNDNDKGASLPITEPGILLNSGEFDGLSSGAAKTAIVKKLISLHAGEEKINYKLRDWVFSRQRYWGEPIPIYFPVTMLTADGVSGDPRKNDPHKICYETPIPVDDKDLPLKLPELTNFEPGDDPQGCLARAVDWRYFQKDGKWYARETNTMPQVTL